jgi:hypothetical protein
MPPLPGLGRNDGLQEPYALGNGILGFSPRNTLVRNNPIGTPNLTLMGGNSTQVSDVTGDSVLLDSERAARKVLLLSTYSNSACSHVLTKQDKRNIADAAKKHLLGRLKFIVSTDKRFTSFWQPDLLSGDIPLHVQELLDAYGTKYRDRMVNDTILIEAAELWKAAAPIMKKQVDNHRAGVAQRMKMDIMIGTRCCLSSDHIIAYLYCI